MGGGSVNKQDTEAQIAKLSLPPSWYQDKATYYEHKVDVAREEVSKTWSIRFVTEQGQSIKFCFRT